MKNHSDSLDDLNNTSNSNTNFLEDNIENSLSSGVEDTNSLFDNSLNGMNVDGSDLDNFLINDINNNDLFNITEDNRVLDDLNVGLVDKSISLENDIHDETRSEELLKTIEDNVSSYFNNPDQLQLGNINTLEQHIGRNFSNYVRNANISFKGIEKLLPLISHDMRSFRNITSKVAEVAVKEFPERTVMELAENSMHKMDLQEIFNSTLKILGIK